MLDINGEREQTIVKTTYCDFGTLCYKKLVSQLTCTLLLRLKIKWRNKRTKSPGENGHCWPEHTLGAVLSLVSDIDYGTSPLLEIPDSTFSDRPSPFFYKPMEREKNF